MLSFFNFQNNPFIQDFSVKFTNQRINRFPRLRNYFSRQLKTPPYNFDHSIFPPAKRCICRWGTCWYLPPLKVSRYALNFLARTNSCETLNISIISPAQEASIVKTDSICRFGIIRICTGATGLTSAIARVLAVSKTGWVLILPSTSLQKIQSFAVIYLTLNDVSFANHFAFFNIFSSHGWQDPLR